MAELKRESTDVQAPTQTSELSLREQSKDPTPPFQQDGLMDTLQESFCLLTQPSNNLLNKMYLSHDACGILRMTNISKETFS